MHAAGVNRPDVLQRLGGYAPPPGASDLPGLEVAGRVVAIGAGCRRFAVGDAVCALVSGGGYAEFVNAPEPQVLPVPDGYSMVEAAGVPETFFTVWTNVFERGALEAGRVAARPWRARRASARRRSSWPRCSRRRVLTTVGNAEKQAFCTELGVERAIDYKTEDFTEVVKEVTDGRGVDVILDMVGGDYVARNLKALAMEGRLVQIAWLGGSKIEANFASLMLKRLTWTGSTLRPRTVEEKGRIAKALEAKVWPLLAKRTVQPIIHAVLPLDEAAAAHELMELSRHIGKIILETGRS